MRKSIVFLFLICSTLISGQSVWKADPADSQIEFTISHLVFSEVSGHFKKFDIEARADNSFNDPVFTGTVETESIDTDNAKRDKDLRKEDYFDVARYPKMSFESTSIKKTGGMSFVLRGNLTIKDKTKPMEFQGRFGDTMKSRENPSTINISFTGTIDRKDFGVGGTTLIPMGDHVDITIQLKMTKR